MHLSPRDPQPLKVLSTAALLSALGLSLLVPGCLRRDIAGAEPSTTNIFVSRIENEPVDKIDLLFVVDNSASMADKQKILEQAVPQMLTRLVRPDCVRRDGDGNVVERSESVAPTVPGENPTCTGELILEFNPVNDIHIGVISSSLGGHGSSACPSDPAQAGSNPENNDRALLMPKVRPGLIDPHGTGFLVWHPADPKDAPGTPVEDNLQQLGEHFRQHVVAAGESGCGFEAPLEAWYRFLVDPAPPRELILNENQATSTGPDTEVLAQRAAFLRSDSLVGIVVLTDENDCSAMEGGDFYANAKLGWMISEYQRSLIRGDASQGEANTRFATATPACEVNANDPCCFSCFLSEAPAACTDPNAIAACSNPGWPRLSEETDHANGRCAQNQKRFGLDLLYPVERYIDGLSSAKIINSQTGDSVKNPLLWGVDGTRARRENLIYFAGITGVPWQDLADEASLNDEKTLSYLSAIELGKASVSLPDSSEFFTRWDLVLGKPGRSALSTSCQEESSSECGLAPIAPLDPFMIESFAPRSGTHPLTGESITRAPAHNSINGHEQKQLENPMNGEVINEDLQYSCTFPLERYGATKECDPLDLGCDCADAPLRERSLCEAEPGESGSTTQHFGKAYPATRILEVLKGFGRNSIPASICPKVHDESEDAFGYNPAVAAIIERLAASLIGQCLPRQLTTGEDGLVECLVVEARHREAGALDCSAAGRELIDSKKLASVKTELVKSGWCTAAECDAASFCALEQLTEARPAEREACLTSPIGSEESLTPGYCYIDAEQELGDTSLVANCPANQKQLLRFVGKETPAPSTTTFVACSGAATAENSGITTER